MPDQIAGFSGVTPPRGLAVYCLIVAGAAAIVVSLLGGPADIRRFHGALGRLLQEKVFPAEPGRVVRMGDFGRDGRPHLKIVSANLSRARIHLFSASRSDPSSFARAASRV